MKANDIVIEKYSDANEIWSLQRGKIKSRKAKILDWLVCLFTPLAEITESADILADLGTYYLAIYPERALLVRFENGEITEQKITESVDGRRFVVDRNRYTKVVKIHG